MKKKTFTVKHKQTVVASYRYSKNGSSIKILAVTPPVNEVDALYMHVMNGKTKKAIGLYMRPDEAVMLIRLLSEAVYKTTKVYQFGIE